ncbi:uncharacterized protein [Littorina saxatilis]|uniref:Uncharacterized protein n=1 Tax=Littorina saxatilis TaxID=31220 RepID=A0AAN9ASQ7_9CAEN
MFSQHQLYGGMERNCYCCRPGPSLPTPALLFPMMEPNSSVPVASLLPNASLQETNIMDVDSALNELDDLQSATGAIRGKSSRSMSQDIRPERKIRTRSLSESMTGSSKGLKHSHSESSLHGPLDAGIRGSHHHHHRKLCSMGSKMIGCSLSLPRSRKVGGYHLVQRNSAFVCDISTTRPRNPLQHSSSLPARWVSVDGSVGTYSDQSSAESSPPNMGVYRDSDLLDERSRQRRLARVRFDRSRRLRQPYSIPFRMCQSMNEDSTASLTDFLTDSTSSHSQSQRASKSTTVSPVKQDLEGSLGASSGVGVLVRSRSIDNLELAKLRLTDVLEAKTPDSDSGATQIELEQVASDLKNLQMV